MMLRLTFALILFALPVRADVQIQDVTSPGGIHAWLVESHDLPFTALEIRFRGGTSLDPEGARGAVNLMAGLLEEGAGDLDAQGFARARDGLAASFSFRPSTDAVAVSARFLTENRDEAVDLLRLALVEPRFDADAIERVRGQVLSGLASDAKDPTRIAGRTFDEKAFGAHPYGSDGSGTPDSVRALMRDDLVAAHRAALARDRIYVAAAGDITAEDLGTLLDRLLGDLPAEGAPMPSRAEWRIGGGVTVVEFPTPQASVRFGHEGIKRDDPDFFPAYVLNEILGGGRFGSRLMTEVREKRGLTYGIGSYLAPMDHAELMMGHFASSNATVGQAVEIVREEWRRAAAEGVTAEELEATKTYLTGSYPLRFDGNGPIASILVGMQMEDLPIDYPVTRNAKVEAVTLEDVKRVAARLLKPEALHFVVVGEPEGLASDG
ncbi:insulinase family protein [Cereibacter azotoformans]|uniref:Zinc protease n=1 Tax=Cereibacter azotoformans TaxID=43057 RepID=A0A2T5K317_9RHOB|nr:pitrilysin family protein [Cereibacter azotoformans]AXQ94687.1 insulinase family protein [Cereibacter sphaeroides]MBO4170460.1 insulinase family protein [Cereibacter azotoformans]PTR16728.1 zinc protease [Cereibacter azotoformans]UIJ30251.1 insulinase family protein [Cereibacter azotoformans]